MDPPFGADAAPDLYAPNLAGPGGFTTTRGGAPASAINPAAGGDAQRIVFDAGYLGIPGLGAERGFGNAIELGALFPTKYAVFGGSLRLLNSPFDNFPIKTTFAGNLNAAKELYPGISAGAGFNFGVGDGWSLSLDLGVRHTIGNLGPLENFTWAAALRGLGKSWVPSWLTPIGGVSFDVLHVRGTGDKADPFKLGIAADVGFPALFYKPSMTFKAGLTMTIAEVLTISTSWPGASGMNARELAEGAAFPAIPSVGIGFDFVLPSGGERIAGGRLPSDGNLAVTAAMKPLYGDIYAMGVGAAWTVGVVDKTPPLILVDYPETVYFSPNNDGRADALEFPITITDSRYIDGWSFQIRDAEGTVVRTYRNKERRPETQGVRNFISRLTDVKSGVEVPPTLRWDGSFDSGEIAPDGVYSFVITAFDDNNNTAVTPVYEVVVDNTPPELSLAEMPEAQRIFSPDGDGNRDTLTIVQTGSEEDLWEGGFYNAAGTRVRTFITENGKPEDLVWDGMDDTGQIVPDGIYSYRISATDRAQNSTSASMGNIIVSTIQPQVGVTISDAYFSPNGDGIKDTVIYSLSVPVKEGITGWALTFRDSQGTARRTIPSNSPRVPERQEFTGRDDRGAVLSEGVYQAEFTVTYRNGYVSRALAPPVTLDITPPRATVQNEYPAFSPNNDGIQDEMFITQEGSDELIWIGDIRRANGSPGERPVRSFRFSGVPPARIAWDGHGDAGTFAADGEYTYELYSTDAAGNTGRSNLIRFALSTADTPVMIGTDTRAFSPNGDGVLDTVNIIPQIQVREGITSYRVDVLNDAGRAVRSFEGSNAPPASITWNGRTTEGAPAPDGNYTAKIELRYVQGNQPSAVSLPFALDTQAPQAELSAPYTIFSPNGDGKRDNIPFTLSTAGNDNWEALISNARGQTIRSWNWTGQAPSLIWDGTDQAGNIVPDGTYQLSLSATDAAGNSTRRNIPNIVLDARVPRAFLTASASGIAPKPDQKTDLVRFSIMLSPQDGIESWSLELRDEGGSPLRVYTGQPAGTPARMNPPPAAIGWNGLTENGALKEGRFTPTLTVNYLKGDVVSVQAPPITVDVSGPVLSFVYQPEYFSPDNDGVDDELVMFMGAQDASPIASWSLEIREPQPPYLLFYRLEGRGSPAERTVWDGRSNSARASGGELVQAATDYLVNFKAADALGNASSLDAVIKVDVLVIRDGDRLRIQVPSIIFRENAADFNSLAGATVDNNMRVLQRIAEILNKFRDYKVQVEGHANPVLRTQAEESSELQPLSESRARAVVNMLVEFGVARGRLSAVGMGGSRPVVRYEDRDNWWKNRRVEFILIK
ncbi:MAG: gliding motility-associated C-terminal domain-containing protein [Treponema sp.]|nr:gliding motility-associated C-terminal domain-containing protein [Treponema sp.]